MAVTYSAATKTARMQAVADKIDGGSGAGKLKIGTSAMGRLRKAKAKEEQKCQHKGHGAEWEHGFSLE